MYMSMSIGIKADVAIETVVSVGFGISRPGLPCCPLQGAFISVTQPLKAGLVVFLVDTLELTRVGASDVTLTRIQVQSKQIEEVISKFHVSLRLWQQDALPVKVRQHLTHLNGGRHNDALIL